MLGEKLRRFLPDMAYAQSEQQARKVILLRAFDSLDEIFCRPFLMPFKHHYLACGYVIDIGDI